MNTATIKTILSITAKTAIAFGGFGFISAPLCGLNASIVYIASAALLALGALLFFNSDIG